MLGAAGITLVVCVWNGMSVGESRSGNFVCCFLLFVVFESLQIMLFLSGDCLFGLRCVEVFGASYQISCNVEYLCYGLEDVYF